MTDQMANDIAILLSTCIALCFLGVAISQLCDEIKDWYHERTQRKLRKLGTTYEEVQAKLKELKSEYP